MTCCDTVEGGEFGCDGRVEATTFCERLALELATARLLVHRGFFFSRAPRGKSRDAY